MKMKDTKDREKHIEQTCISGNGRWFWTPDWTEADRKTARLVYFRREFPFDSNTVSPEQSAMTITADCRYKLYVNDHLVQYGPAKGDHQVHYYDTVQASQIRGYLQEGRNVLTVAVLHNPEDPAVGCHGMFSSDTPGLFISGELSGNRSSEDPESGSWECFVDRSVRFDPEEEDFSPLQIHEKRLVAELNRSWQPVVVRNNSEMPVYLRQENLRPRPIPPMFLEKHSFQIPVREITPHTREEFVLDAGEEMCAFPVLKTRGGAGAKITLLYSECYTVDGTKGDRTDASLGTLEGYSDQYILRGSKDETTEPFWFRTFRFLKVTVETADEPVQLLSFDYLETGYPLEVRTSVTTSDPSLDAIREISLRTLRRCMHETYVDCPYYEQLQYIMDARSEILYTYAVSGDDRLARKTIAEFARAQRPDGLLNCSYPNTNVNVIPGFSIYYILMVHDHMMYFGDWELVQDVLPVIRRVLMYFARNVNKKGPFAGLVGRTGGVNGQGELWSFIDWAQEWMDTTGMPPAGLVGPLTMESLLFVLGLQKAAELEDYAGDSEIAEIYRSQAAAVQRAVRNLCMDAEGFLTDGPVETGNTRSQHCQVFGILTGTLSEENTPSLLLRSITDDGFARCSVAMCFYLFRALEQTGLYEYTDRFWDIWRSMIRNHCTTCVEAEHYARSECHAWGALALYELPCTILGVRPAAPGFEKIQVSPCPGYLTSASGIVHTPKGDLSVSWNRNGNDIDLDIDCEEGLRARLVL